MTFRAAFNQAFVELGMRPESVEAMTKQTELALAMPNTGELPEGKEREFIDFIKRQAKEAIGEAVRDPEAYKQKWTTFAKQRSSAN